jgi:hypothetical protein
MTTRRGAGAGARSGYRSATPAAWASQRVASGQSPHRGARGVHTTAPSSISAWLTSRGGRVDKLRRQVHNRPRSGSRRGPRAAVPAREHGARRFHRPGLRAHRGEDAMAPRVAPHAGDPRSAGAGAAWPRLAPPQVTRGRVQRARPPSSRAPAWRRGVPLRRRGVGAEVRDRRIQRRSTHHVRLGCCEHSRSPRPGRGWDAAPGELSPLARYQAVSAATPSLRPRRPPGERDIPGPAPSHAMDRSCGSMPRSRIAAARSRAGSDPPAQPGQRGGATCIRVDLECRRAPRGVAQAKPSVRADEAPGSSARWSRQELHEVARSDDGPHPRAPLQVRDRGGATVTAVLPLCGSASSRSSL